MLSLLAPLLCLQGAVLEVDDDLVEGPFATIQAAVDAAAPGDVVLVHDGDYSGFTIDGFSLTVIAPQGSTVNVDGRATVQNLAANDVVVLSSLKLDGQSSSAACLLSNNLGTVLVQDCILTHGVDSIFESESDGANVQGCSQVVFTDTSISGGLAAGFTVTHVSNHGLDIAASNVSLYRCSVAGGTGALDRPGGTGGMGVRIIGGSLRAFWSDLQGGDGGPGDFSLAFGCGDGGDGGAGLQVLGNAVCELFGSTTQGGSGGPPGGAECATGGAGPATDELMGMVMSTPLAFASLDAPAPVTAGGMTTDTYTGTPGDSVWLIVAKNPAPALTKKQFTGSLFLAPTIFVYPIGTIPMGGVLQKTLNLSPIANDSAGFFAQPVFLGGSGFVLGGPHALLAIKP